MRRLEGKPFDDLRVRGNPYFGGFDGDETCGTFAVPVGDATLLVVASTGAGWDHVSASLPDRCPTWEEMSALKRIFFEEKEWAMEYHPPAALNISVHPYCLHLWRPRGVVMPVPPRELIA